MPGMVQWHNYVEKNDKSLEKQQQKFKGATHPDLFHFVEVQLDQLVLHSAHQHMAGPGVVDHAVHVHPGIKKLVFARILQMNE